MPFRVVRKTDDGGAVPIGLNEHGDPEYTRSAKGSVQYVYRRDAERFMDKCQFFLPKLAGQGDFEVVEVK